MRGFSLVELSIVMVIIGLIIGGIVAGQSMIRASEVTGVTTEVAQFTSAVQNFKTKFSALPGDMRNATSYWGTATTCPGTQASPKIDKRTCNGDGDGDVGSTERHLFWHHLSAADLIAGKFTGVQSASGSIFFIKAGVNIPESKLTAGSYGMYTTSNSLSVNYYNEDRSRHALQLATHNNSGIGSATPVLTPKESRSIDNKMDDGLPAYGKVRPRTPTKDPNCSTSATAASAKYKLDEKVNRCALQFYMGF